MSDDFDDLADPLAGSEDSPLPDEASARAERAERRAERLVAQLAQRQAQVDALRQRLDVMQGESSQALHTVEASLRELVDAVEVNATERDAARRERDRATDQLQQVETRIAEAEAAKRDALARGEELGNRLALLQPGSDTFDVHAGAPVALTEQRARIRELELANWSLTLTLGAIGRDIERAERSRSWRIGHGLARLANRLRRRRARTDGALRTALRRIEKTGIATGELPTAHRRTLPAGPRPDPQPEPEEPGPALDPEEVAAQRVALAGDIRRRLGPPPALDDWPAVSIVVPTRDGREHLERLFVGLREHTDYPRAELIVIDNASTDGSAEWVEASDAGMPVHVLRNQVNASFTEASEQGVAAATGDLVLLLNNDVELFEPGWLRELVAAHVLGGHALTGATLLHAEGTSARAADGHLVQHRGIRLRSEHGHVRAYNHGDGEPLFGDDFGVERQAPAVSAACLLVARSTFEDLGGLSSRFRYGLEDVDLGLRTTAAGLRAVTSGRSVLYHAESVTPFAHGADFTRMTRDTNSRALLERWGPAMRRSYRQARLAGDRTWTDGCGPHAAVVLTSVDEADGWDDWHTGHGLGDALTRLGWRISYLECGGGAPLPADADYVITLLDRFDARDVPAEVPVVAWIRDWTDRWLEQPWFGRLDVLLASSSVSAGLVEARTGRLPLLFPLATDAARFGPAAAEPDRVVDCVFVGDRWGEARAIEPALVPGRGQKLAIHGRNWKGMGELSRYDLGPAGSDELPAIYASARLALDDTQTPTLRYQAVNARVFDALAAGTPVLTNCVGGVRELFDEEFPVWESPEDLRRERDSLLADDARRERLAARYREVVLSRHTYERRAHELVGVLREREALPSFCIKIGAPDWDQAQRWGDLHFARGIERELRRRGHRCLVQVLEEWEEPEALSYDVTLHLKGLSRHHPKPGQRNVLWCISHPAELTGEECDGYDLVCIASESFAARMRTRTSTPVMVLEQATDPELFFPEPDEPARHDLVYVANSRNVLRPMMRDLLPTDLDVAVYGANWKGLIDSRYVLGEHVPNEDLRRLYSSAKIVLADHWDDMRESGFIANRIYDALACGACVVSDDVDDLSGRFDGAVATYTTREDLRALIDRLLADPEERQDRGRRGRMAMRREGGFGDRVDLILRGLQGPNQAPAEGAG